MSAVKLQNMDVIPESHYNLISITKLMGEGHKVTANKKDGMTEEMDSSSSTSEPKLQREYCGVHTSNNQSLKAKLLQE